MTENKSDSNVVSVSLNNEQKAYLKENKISPTNLMKDTVNNLMNSDEVVLKYTPVEYLNQGKRLGLILMLTGIFSLIVGLIAISYLLVVIPMSGLEFAGLSGMILVVGVAIAYYGFNEYTKYDDEIYRRSRVQEQE